MNSTTRLSVIIITYNEAENIRACLKSVAWADEIIVVDSGSEDNTIAICREFTDNIIINAEWPGFGPQKNLALDHATGDWVFSIDADERITPSLQAEIEDIIDSDSTTSNIYSVPRQAFFLGKAMKHGGWWPDYVARLFPRDCARFSNGLVHEKILFKGNPLRLQHPLLHHSYITLGQVLDKMNRYSSAGAQQAVQQNRQGNLGQAMFRGIWAFFNAYIIRAGLLDGQEGFIAAVSKAEGTFYKYLKISYLNSESKQ